MDQILTTFLYKFVDRFVVICCVYYYYIIIWKLLCKIKIKQTNFIDQEKEFTIDILNGVYAKWKDHV